MVSAENDPRPVGTIWTLNLDRAGRRCYAFEACYVSARRARHPANSCFGNGRCLFGGTPQALREGTALLYWLGGGSNRGVWLGQF